MRAGGEFSEPTLATCDNPPFGPLGPLYLVGCNIIYLEILHAEGETKPTGPVESISWGLCGIGVVFLDPGWSSAIFPEAASTARSSTK